MLNSIPLPRRFPLTIFLSAFLLFQLQPMMGRYLLPWFGGGPAVWTTCMLFFQMLLLAGYAYAHWLGSTRDSRRQAIIHIALLAASLAFLPLSPQLGRTALGDPSLAILQVLLCTTVGGPYLLLSATRPASPTLVHAQPFGQSPVASLRSLQHRFVPRAPQLSVPPGTLPAPAHAKLDLVWTLCNLCDAMCSGPRGKLRPVSRSLSQQPGTRNSRPTFLTILFWLGLPAAGSTVLLATTNQISQEIAVNPFLWVIPLSVYLLTFILTFESDRWYRRWLFAIGSGIMAPVACAVMAATVALTLQRQLEALLIALFVVCMLCHGELARARPGPRYLTVFYLTIAGGGAVGGLFVALIAPRVFTEYGEFPIGMAVSCLLGFIGWLRTGAFRQWTTGNFAVRLPLMALLLGGLTAIAAFVINLDHPGVERFRNFYGILRIGETVDGNGPLRQLTHGAIRHGFPIS